MRLSSKPFKDFADTYFEGKNAVHNYITGMQEVGIPRIFYCGWIESEKDKKEIQTHYPNCCFNHRIGLPTRQFEGDLEVPEQIPVELTLFNKRMMDNYHKHRKYSMNKCRGSGASEILTIRWMIFKYGVLNVGMNRKCMILPGTSSKLAHEFSTRIKAICDKIPQIYERIPNSNKPIEFNFKTGGRIMLMPASFDSIRGFENVGDIVMEEVAHWDMIDDMPVYYSSQAVHTKTQCHVIHSTTPRGRRGFYYNLVWDSVANSDFHKHTVNWREIVGLPIRDIETLQEYLEVHGEITTKDIEEWRLQLRQFYIDDVDYRVWFNDYFNGIPFDEIIDVKTPILDVNSIVKDSLTSRAAYDQELDNQFIATDNRAMGDFREEYIDTIDLRKQIETFDVALAESKVEKYEEPDF